MQLVQKFELKPGEKRAIFFHYHLKSTVVVVVYVITEQCQCNTSVNFLHTWSGTSLEYRHSWVSKMCHG